LLKELRQLEKRYDGRKWKVDHPDKGSKDISDALAASCFALSVTQSTQPLPIVKGLSYSGDAWLEEQRQSVYAGNVSSAQNSDMLMPFFTNGGKGGSDDGWGGNGSGGGWYPG
jgi:hypothetical protein